ncbi:MAG: MarR family transcriptional regulator [Solirubrobacterales bacterium]|nr:MarR family transcriptional regulator [Solirubrobacterales bacterium]
MSPDARPRAHTDSSTQVLPATTATASDLELAARLRLAVTRLARRLRQQSAEGLTPSQTSALASIVRRGPLTPSELASIERIQRPTATRVLGHLIAAGLVTREADALDRRIARVRVTREGAAVLRRGRSRKNAYLAKRLRKLEPEDLQTLERAAELIERLIEDGEDQTA